MGRLGAGEGAREGSAQRFGSSVSFHMNCCVCFLVLFWCFFFFKLRNSHVLICLRRVVAETLRLLPCGEAYSPEMEGWGAVAVFKWFCCFGWCVFLGGVGGFFFFIVTFVGFVFFPSICSSGRFLGVFLLGISGEMSEKKSVRKRVLEVESCIRG